MEKVPKLKPEEEFTNGLIQIGNMMLWVLMSEDIQADLLRMKARHEREEMYGRAHAQAV